MAIINTGAISKALWPGVNTFFGLAYNEYPAEFTEIFKTQISERNFEEDVNMNGLGLGVVKPEGTNVSYASMAQGFVKRYVPVAYALGFIVSHEALADNLYMELAAARAKNLAFGMRQSKEIIAANVLNRAFNSSYTGADGIELCATTHKLSKGGTYANKLATAADLSEASLEQAMIDIQSHVDDANMKIRIMPQKLVIPKELQFDAERILKSTLQVDTANNTLNALRSKGMLPGGYTVNHYLTDTDAFFILTDAPDGLKHIQREAITLSNDTDFDSDNLRFKAYERYDFSWSDPRGIFGSAGA